MTRSQPHPIAGAEPEPRTGNKKGGDPDKRETQLPGPWTINHDFHLVLVIWKPILSSVDFTPWPVPFLQFMFRCCNQPLKSETEYLDSEMHYCDTRS